MEREALTKTLQKQLTDRRSVVHRPPLTIESASFHQTTIEKMEMQWHSDDFSEDCVVAMLIAANQASSRMTVQLDTALHDASEPLVVPSSPVWRNMVAGRRDSCENAVFSFVHDGIELY